VATILAREGVDVAVADLHEERAQGTVAAVEAANGAAIAVAVDVTDDASVRAAVATAESWRGQLDILVNAAGIYRVGTYAEVTTSAWDLVQSVNLRGSFLTCQAVLPGMVARRRGAIVNLASISGRTRATLAAPSYVASKAGIIGLTMSLAMQAAPSGVRVNAVAPGPTETEMILGLPDDMQAKVLATIPIGRFATTAEVASAIVFLASDLSGSTTGETLNINGGAFMV
jgi:NAD(P)-dependent dehydrogenase (short-subunit alcohol dehydrogenase family)